MTPLCNEPETPQLCASAARALLLFDCELSRRSNADDAMYCRSCNEPEAPQLCAAVNRPHGKNINLPLGAIKSSIVNRWTSRRPLPWYWCFRGRGGEAQRKTSRDDMSEGPLAFCTPKHALKYGYQAQSTHNTSKNTHIDDRGDTNYVSARIWRWWLKRRRADLKLFGTARSRGARGEKGCLRLRPRRVGRHALTVPRRVRSHAVAG